MKTKFHLIAGVAMIAAFASCSNDDLVANPEVQKPFDMTTGYAKVAISMSNGGTRAEGFDAGTKEEAQITDIVLALYDEYDHYVGKGVLADDGTFNVQGTTGNVSDTYSKIFKLELNEGANKPTKVVAFINTGLDNSNLNVLTTVNEKTPVVSSIFTGQGTDASYFAMTNSGYYSGGNYVVAADIKAIYDTEEQARDAATDATTTIYVERLAAKITVKANESLNENTKNYIIRDTKNAEVELNFTPKFWGATGVANEEYLVKTKFTSHTDWNAPANFRSYWAEGVNYSLDFGKYCDETGNLVKGNPLTYITYGDYTGYDGKSTIGNLTPIGEKPIYVPEHTTKLQMTKDQYLVANTYALVVGEYTIADATQKAKYTNEEGHLDFYLLLTGMEGEKKQYTIYTEAELIEKLLEYNGYTLSDLTVDGEPATTKAFGLDYQDGKYVLTVEANTVQVKGAEPEKFLSDADLTKSTNSRHYHYVNGNVYFNAPIVHQKPSTDSKDDVYGVVRNHSYILTITAVTTLGLPLNGDIYDDPEDPIIPTPDELKDHYINAEINVLSWHVHGYDVTL